MKQHFPVSLCWLFLALGLSTSCKKDELMTYEGKNSVYFYKPLYGYGIYHYDVTDSANIYLGYNTADSVLSLTVKILGKPTDRNRPYALIVDKDSSTAVVGTDYTLTSLKEVPANKYSDTINIHIKNRRLPVTSPGLTLLLRLQANDAFELPLQEARGGYRNSYTWAPYRFKMNFIYGAPKPYYWDRNADFLGTYSPEKIRLMIAYLKLEMRAIIGAGYTYNNDNVRRDAVIFKGYLDSEAAKGHIIREADGTPMKMGPKL